MVPIVGISTVSVAPAFLVGALGVEMGDDLGFGPAALGLAVSIYFLATAVTTHSFGRFADRVGGRRAAQIALSWIACSLVGMAIVTRQWWMLIPFLVVGGMGNAMAGPTASLLLARAIPAGRLGFAFGVKQSSVPLATLLSGMAIPLVAVHVGWRWVLIGAGVLTLSVVPSLSPVARAMAGRQAPPPSAQAPGSAMAFFAIGFGFVIASVTSLGALVVDSAVASGFSQGTGGTVLAIGSLVAVIVRIGLGWWADRTDFNVLWVIVAMMAVGSVGYGFLTSTHLGFLLVGVVVAFGVGWGWSGLMMMAITKHNLGAPATATGTIQTGAAIGGVVGPSTTGFLAEHVGYTTAWLTAGASMILAAAAVSAGTILLAAHLAVETDAGAVD